MHTVLSREGYAVTTCGSAREALEALEMAPADLIITDLCMPELSGLDVVRALREAVDGTPILVSSAIYIPSMREETLNAGASDALGKPFTYWELLDSVSALLRGASSRSVVSCQ